MKKFLLIVSILMSPSFLFADRLGSLKSNADVLLTTQASNGGYALEPATVTPNFQYGVLASTMEVAAPTGEMIRLNTTNIGATTALIGYKDWTGSVLGYSGFDNSNLFIPLSLGKGFIFQGPSGGNNGQDEILRIESDAPNRVILRKGSISLLSTSTVRFYDGTASPHYTEFVASNTLLNNARWVLPDSTGTVNSALSIKNIFSDHVDTYWQTISGGGTPAGSNTQIQFNNSSSFGASANLIWDGTFLTTYATTPNSQMNIGSGPDGSDFGGIWMGAAPSSVNYAFLASASDPFNGNIADVFFNAPGTTGKVFFRQNNATYMAIAGSRIMIGDAFLNDTTWNDTNAVLTVGSYQSAAVKPLTVKGAASQSVDLTQWQDSNANVKTVVDKNGALVPYPRTKTQLASEVPAEAGAMYYCSDCTVDAIVVSTGTSAGQFARISARTTGIQ